ncbi:MAG: RNA polymerase sigma factor [Paracoccaceae bacterium]
MYLERQQNGSDGDAGLLRRFADGDQSAARTLVARHLHGVHATASRMLRDRTEAEDVAQEAMLRLWRIAPEWQDGRARVSTWLHRVTVNLCIDRLRRRRRIDPGEVPDRADDAPGAEARLQGKSRRAALQAALARLPERQRLAIMLRHFEELPNGEIADILGISVEAVESLLARGRRALAAELSGQRGALGLM